MLAAEVGHDKIVDMLLQASADPDIAGPYGERALMMAVQYEHPKVVKSLCIRRAGVYLVAGIVMVVLVVVMPLQLPQRDLLLAATTDSGVRHTDLEMRSRAWPTPPADASPLDIAARHNRVEAMAILLEYGANVNQASADGSTAVYIAAEAKSIDACQLLLEWKADPGLSTTTGQNALKIACLGDYDYENARYRQGPHKLLAPLMPQALLKKNMAAMISFDRDDDSLQSHPYSE